MYSVAIMDARSHRPFPCILGYHTWKAAPTDGGRVDLQCEACHDSWPALSEEEVRRVAGPAPFLPTSPGRSPSLDVGCGFIDGLYQPIYATVSLDLNMGRVEAPLLAKLRHHGSHPLGADALHLPLRSGCIRSIHWRSVLEHLPDPLSAVLEGKRVLRPGGRATIILPILENLLRYYLVALATQFPFSLPATAAAMRRTSNWRIPGMMHLWGIRPGWLKAHFSDVWVRKYYGCHKWFSGPWRWAAELLTNGRFMPDVQGLYMVTCRVGGCQGG